ncbi:GAF domain-containing protein [uncultured Nocardioides sp.]|uniref:GAF domain-containing protein n=2 Tax=uncultured Nocardioides sp. TaxID=198441 RepID=UPI002603F95E|nr:GAF domain-containing protein [uncultured Nocardioides sp.]
MPDAPRTPHPAADPWFARLRPHRSEDETLDLLLAEAASQLGCGVAAILMVREQTRELEYVALHGDAGTRRLLHTHLPDDYVLSQVEAADMIGRVRHLSAEARAGAGFVPPGEPRTSPEAWHPDDLLMGVLRSGSQLRGLVLVDEPLNGKVPTDRVKARLHDWVVARGAEILDSDERRRREEEEHLAGAAAEIVGLMRAQLGSPTDLAQACLEVLRVALDARVVVAHVVEEDSWRRISGRIAVPDGEERAVWASALPLVDQLARERAVVVSGEARMLGPTAWTGPLAEVVGPWTRREGSPQMVVLPLAHDLELLGLAVVTRDQRARQWTDIEIAMARQVATDLGRIIGTGDFTRSALDGAAIRATPVVVATEPASGEPTS